ncbi:MAG: hypothetical protein K2N26_07505 [Oscillospiraceae bacterium]|nr:hypothetical protein [Oscillospiraceae bacterium]
MVFRFAVQCAPKRFLLQKFPVNGIKPVSEKPAFPFQSVRKFLFGREQSAIRNRVYSAHCAVVIVVAAASAVIVAVVVIAAAEPENEKDDDDPAAVVAIAKNSTVHKDTLLKNNVF